MKNQEFKDHGTKYQVLRSFGICYGELGGSKLRVFRIRTQFQGVAPGEAGGLQPPVGGI